MRLLFFMVGWTLWMPAWRPAASVPITTPRPLDNPSVCIDPKASTAHREGLDLVWAHGLGAIPWNGVTCLSGELAAGPASCGMRSEVDGQNQVEGTEVLPPALIGRPGSAGTAPNKRSWSGDQPERITGWSDPNNRRAPL